MNYFFLRSAQRAGGGQTVRLATVRAIDNRGLRSRVSTGLNSKCHNTTTENHLRCEQSSRRTFGRVLSPEIRPGLQMSATPGHHQQRFTRWRHHWYKNK